MKNHHKFEPGAWDALEGRLTLSGQANTLMFAPHVARAVMVGVASTAAPAPRVARFEARWMRAMITHHGMAIRMAQLALENSENPAVHDLAERIISAQTREIGQMRRWLSAWYRVEGVRPRRTGPDREMLRELGSLRGEAFDRAFLGEMMGHHQAAIDDANQLLTRAFHAPLRQLGTNIITTQTAEIGKMQAMLGGSGGMALLGHY